MLRYLTSGESHGSCLMGIIEGMPSGLTIDEAFINAQLEKRQGGYGRGGRQQIETDRVTITGGVLQGISTGAPIGLVIKNKDNSINDMPELTRPRPGHADLAGSLKYHQGIRPVLERASARSTAMNVAVGSCAALLNSVCGIESVAHVVQIGSVSCHGAGLTFDAIVKGVSLSQVGCADHAIDEKMVAVIDAARAAGDTVGGVVEVRFRGVPIGIGSPVHADRKLDARIAGAVMGVPAIKAVSIGLGFAAAEKMGSQVHDEIGYESGKGYVRPTNNAGGIEGGMSNGEEIVVRAAMKPIATLKKALRSVDMKTKKTAEASFERSDTCAVTACAVIVEAVVAFEIASALCEKFGGDSLVEIQRNLASYREQIGNC